MENVVLNATLEDKGKRIDQYICENLEDKTRSSIQKQIANGDVLVNDKIIAKNYKINTGDKVVITMLEPEILDVVAQDIPIEIVYEDDDLLVVNKPKGMVVHPAVGNYDGTLVNALMYHCKDSLSSINGVIRPGIVHRIDKDTSGLLIVAKNDKSHAHLAAQIKAHSLIREYECIVYGGFKEETGIVDAPIGRSKNDRKKMCITEVGSREAVTEYTVIQGLGQFTHLRLKLQTGRTHQIRVHMAHIGHPVIGDEVYGPNKVIKNLNGQCLHAKTIGFVHPTTGENMYFDSELPEYFDKFLKLQIQNKVG